MIGRRCTTKLTLLVAATVLAACGVEQAPDTEVQGLTIEEPAPEHGGVDGDDVPSSAVTEVDEMAQGTSSSHGGTDSLTLSELQEDDTPWHLLPRADWPTRPSVAEADCQALEGEPVAC